MSTKYENLSPEALAEVHRIERVYNNLVRVHQKHGRSPHCMPAVEFEQQTGLSGVAGNWKFPEGKTATQMEHAYLSQYHKYGYALVSKSSMTSPSAAQKEAFAWFEKESEKKLPEILKIHDELVKLNPELDTIGIDRNNYLQVHNVIHGATSRFNADDIREFIFDGGHSMRNKNYLALESAILGRTKLKYLGWVPALKTLQMIDKKLDEKGVRKFNVDNLLLNRTMRLGKD